MCANQVLKPGDRLPSVRQLAQELAVNQNTILRVYERLTMEGLLERRHGDGTFVADRMPAGQMKKQRDHLTLELRTLVERAQMLGLEKADVYELVDETFDNRKSNQKGAGLHAESND